MVGIGVGRGHVQDVEVERDQTSERYENSDGLPFAGRPGGDDHDRRLQQDSQQAVGVQKHQGDGAQFEDADEQDHRLRCRDAQRAEQPHRAAVGQELPEGWWRNEADNGVAKHSWAPGW